MRQLNIGRTGGPVLQKRSLKKDILDKRIKGWKPKQVYLDPEHFDQFYKYYKYENFRTNLHALRKACEKGVSGAERDQIAFAAHTSSYVPPIGQWHRSDAQKLLRRLVQLDMIDGMFPTEIREQEPLFEAYTLKQFRDHLYHEKARHWKKMHEKDYSDRVKFLKATVDTTN